MEVEFYFEPLNFNVRHFPRGKKGCSDVIDHVKCVSSYPKRSAIKTKKPVELLKLSRVYFTREHHNRKTVFMVNVKFTSQCSKERFRNVDSRSVRIDASLIRSILNGGEILSSTILSSTID